MNPTVPEIESLKEKQVTKFFSKIEKLGNESGCWMWTGTLDACGYGRTKIGKRRHQAHRVAFCLSGRDLTDEKPLILHSCDSPWCCNPAHLRAGTPADNADDKCKRNRCPTGLKNGSHTHPESRPHGTNHWRAKLDDAKVRTIRARIAAGNNSAEIAREFGVSRTSIRNIRSLKIWRSVPIDGPSVGIQCPGSGKPVEALPQLTKP